MFTIRQYAAWTSCNVDHSYTFSERRKPKEYEQGYLLDSSRLLYFSILLDCSNFNVGYS